MSATDGSGTLPTSNKTSQSELEASPEWRAKHIGLDETWHPQVKRLSETAGAYTRHCIRNWPRRSRWLVIGGQTGSGKTHASKRILERFGECRIWAWEQGYWGGRIPHAMFWPWSKLVGLDEDQWDTAVEDIAGYSLPKRADLLVIDDVGAETDRYKTGVPTERLQAILDLMEHRWLVVTTNVPRSEWDKRWDRRISSRLQMAGYVSCMQVPDYRPTLSREKTT